MRGLRPGQAAGTSEVNIRVYRPADLTATDLAVWSHLHRVDPRVTSPFLHPNWSLASGAVLENVEVGVMSLAGETVGFFPYERSARGKGGPVGGPLNDGDGMVVRPGLTWDPSRIVRACGLWSWRFGHRRPAADPLQPFDASWSPAARLNLKDGFDAYRVSREASGSRAIKATERKARKLGREHGLVRFEMHSTDSRTAEKLISWKSTQLRQLGYRDAFAGANWVVPLLGRLESVQSADFSSVLSALFAGDRMIAAHWGLQSGNFFVSAVPAHDLSFATYSPGAILMVALAHQAATSGVHDLELGLGLNQMKTSLMTHTVPLATGIVDATVGARMYRRARGFLSRATGSTRPQATDSPAPHRDVAPSG